MTTHADTPPPGPDWQRVLALLAAAAGEVEAVDAGSLTVDWDWASGAVTLRITRTQRLRMSPSPLRHVPAVLSTGRLVSET